MDGRLKRTSDFLGILAIFLAVAYARFFQSVLLDAMRESPDGGRLDKDALGYYELAIQNQPFYTASLREPLFPKILGIGIRLFGTPEVLANHFLARQLTGWMGLALIMVIGTLGWKLAGPWCGVISAWMYATSASANYYSVSGLREIPVSLLLVLLVLLLVWNPPSRASRWCRYVSLALACGALPLIRLDSLIVLPAILAAWALIAGLNSLRVASRVRCIIATALAYTLIAWAAAAPFLIACKKEFGRPFAVMNYHATYWRNHEFAGTPGFPTREEVIADPHRGEAVTTAQYIFGDHSIGEVAARYIKGYWLCLTKYTPLVFSVLLPTTDGLVRLRNPLVWFWVLGLGLAFRLWRTQGLIPLAALAVQFPFAFILPLNSVLPGRYHAGVELRFSMPIAPFIALLVGIGVAETICFLRRRVTLKQPASRPLPPEP